MSVSISNSFSRSTASSDDRLLGRLREVVRRDRACEAELVEILGEVDARRLYLEQACSSMFDYCVRVLRFAEGVAYKRIAVARAARRHPEILAALWRGEIHLTAACLIAPHLDGRSSGSLDGTGTGTATATGDDGRGRNEGVGDWLALARHATAREIKRRIADRKPKPEVTTLVRRLPVSSAGGMGRKSGSGPVPVRPRESDRSGSGDDSRRLEGHGSNESPASTVGMARTVESCPTSTSTSISRSTPPLTVETDSRRERGRCEALGAERYAIRFVVDGAVHEQLQELQALLRHSIPDGDVAKILARSIGVLLGQVRDRKLGAGARTRASRGGCGISNEGSGASGSKTPSRHRLSEADIKAPSRHIPVTIRRAVWARDAGRCTFVSRAGKSCGAREFLEFHHRVPWAHRREHSVDNIGLRCRAHNQYEAELDFGTEKMAHYRERHPTR